MDTLMRFSTLVVYLTPPIGPRLTGKNRFGYGLVFAEIFASTVAQFGFMLKIQYLYSMVIFTSEIFFLYFPFKSGRYGRVKSV
jgi:hypothetical protein